MTKPLTLDEVLEAHAEARAEHRAAVDRWIATDRGWNGATLPEPPSLDPDEPVVVTLRRLVELQDKRGAETVNSANEVWERAVVDVHAELLRHGLAARKRGDDERAEAYEHAIRIVTDRTGVCVH